MGYTAKTPVDYNVVKDKAIQALRMAGAVKEVRDEVESAVRALPTYSTEQLNKIGVIGDKGTVDAEKLWTYLSKVTETALSSRNLDANDHAWKAQWTQFQQIAEVFGKGGGVSHDYSRQLASVYTNALDARHNERDNAEIASLDTATGKAVNTAIAYGTGVTSYNTAIMGATDPQKNAAVKTNFIHPRMNNTVQETLATSDAEPGKQLDDLEAKVLENIQTAHRA